MKKEFNKKVSFNKGGGNSGHSGRVILPKEFIEELNITKDDNEVIIYLEEDKIIIKKTNLINNKKAVL